MVVVVVVVGGGGEAGVYCCKLYIAIIRNEEHLENTIVRSIKGKFRE